jgi:hypothetical protein
MYFQQQYTNQCTFIRVAVGVAGVVVIISSSITGIPDLMQLCMNIISYNLLIFSDDCNSVYTKNTEK